MHPKYGYVLPPERRLTELAKQELIISETSSTALKKPAIMNENANEHERQDVGVSGTSGNGLVAGNTGTTLTTINQNHNPPNSPPEL
jgi:hypothetical protein